MPAQKRPVHVIVVDGAEVVEVGGQRFDLPAFGPHSGFSALAAARRLAMADPGALVAIALWPDDGQRQVAREHEDVGLALAAWRDCAEAMHAAASGQGYQEVEAPPGPQPCPVCGAQPFRPDERHAWVWSHRPGCEAVADPRPETVGEADGMFTDDALDALGAEE